MMSAMTKITTTIDDAGRILVDAALVHLAHLKSGDAVNLEINESTIKFSPADQPVIDADKAAETARRLIKKNDLLFKNLS